ncbi:hypothetical protein L6164_034634 [Bauhinia variegata]|uniref:Uncharacterized protein n=1 Tax=Bauhinia variegata TaxID=167791 RepID=A0ACB9KVF0_BAUVA|nr:hypothetical protein L6164_034634 [Bauhinia variegata]
MKNRGAKNEKSDGNLNKSGPMGIAKKKMKKSKNLLDAFAKSKSKDGHYNPALIKKQREFYKNAKSVKKFKKFINQQNQQDGLSSASGLIESQDEPEDTKDANKKRTKKNGSFSLEELYKKKHEEIEKERMEREAAIRAKKEEREKAEARRKAIREKMLKKTRTGQPVMKYRIEHLLETIQGSTKNSADKKS